MSTERKLALLDHMIDSAIASAGSVSDAEDWRRRVVVVLRKVFDDAHSHVANAQQVRFAPLVSASTVAAQIELERLTVIKGVTNLVSILQAARQEVEIDQDADAPPTDSSWVDLQLWGHVNTLVEAEDWDKVVRESTAFFEDWVRTKAWLPKTVISADLMTQAFKPPGGPLVLGSGHPGEAEGWHKMARGLSESVRNATGHRILGSRSDAKSYAMGVLGTVTLLMTQVRAEHL